MGNFIKYICAIVLPFIIVIIIVNYYVDPANVYKSEQLVSNIIYGHKLGYNVINVNNIDERLYKKELIKLYSKQHFDYIILGSSRTMTISNDSFNNKRILNLGVSGCKIEDIIALYQIVKDNNISYTNIIIGVDPTLFNENDTDTRWQSLSDYYYKYTNQKGPLIKNQALIINLLSISYFQNSIKNLINGTTTGDDIEYVTTDINLTHTKRKDGSIYYDSLYVSRSQQDIDIDAATWEHSSFGNFYSISKTKKETLSYLINDIKNNGANVIYFCCPYHPIFYNRIIGMRSVVESISYIYEDATENNIQIIGKYNPNNLELYNYDFYDAVHLKKEKVDCLIKSQLE